MTSLNKTIKPLTSSLQTLSHRFQQQCSVSGTAKGKGKVKEGAILKRSKITIKKGGAQQPDPSSQSKGGGRKSNLEQIIDDCLHSKPHVRSLKSKHRQREAEREKMGLLSEERKLEIANFKKQAKKDMSNNNVSSAENQGALMIGTQGLDLIKLGVVDGEKLPKYELTAEDGMKLAKEYSRVLMRKHRARQAAESGLLKCKKEAIEALPDGLKEKALVPDLAPFPVNRFMATLTPPIEGYIEKVAEVAKRQGTIKGKLR